MPAPLTTIRPDLAERLDERTEEDLQTGVPKVAHMVRTDPGESAVAKVTASWGVD